MRILQVTNYFKPSWESGGVARVVYEISKYLVNSGHAVTVYTTNKSIVTLQVIPNKEYLIENIRVYYFENLRKFFPWRDLISIPYYLPLIIKKEISNFDIIHIHEHRTLLAAIVYFYARNNNTPYLVQAHGSIPYSIGNYHLKKIFDFIIGKKILKNSSLCIALSKLEFQDYVHLGVERNKIQIVPNGINLSHSDNLKKRGDFRKKYNIADNKKIILYLGRIDKIKGIDLLINAFYSLIQFIDDLILVIAGPDTGYLLEICQLIEKLKISDSIIITGPIYDFEKFEAFREAYLFVLPSRYETFPMTILEAFALEIPVITTNNCGIADIIKSNRAGIIINFNTEELKEAIIELLFNLEMREKCIVNGKNLVRCDYSSNVTNKKMLHIYSNFF